VPHLALGSHFGIYSLRPKATTQLERSLDRSKESAKDDKERTVRARGTETEFVTIMWFSDLAAVCRFSGADYEVSVVPAKARALLARFDERSAHYDTVLPPPAAVTAW